MATVVADLEVKIGGDSSEAEASLKRVSGLTTSTAKDANNAGKAAMGLGLGIAAGLGYGVSSAIDFSAAMNGVSAVTGATGEEFDALSALALQIGTDTAFGATEGAQAIEELAKSGVSTTDILGGTAMAAATLAAATGTDIPQAAQVMANAMNVFGLSGKDAVMVADVLTAATNASSASMTDMAAGMRTVGPTAAMFGESITDTATAVALFTNYGLSGADAGISLNRMLVDLSTPTSDAAQAMTELGISAFDATGNFVGFPDLFEQLKSSMGGMTDEQKQATMALLFGAEAADVAGMAIDGGAAAFNELRAVIDSNGQALDASNTRMAGVSGAMEQLNGSVETAAIMLGQTLTPEIEALAGGLKTLVDGFAGLPGPVQQAIGVFLALAAVSLTLGGGWVVFGSTITSTISGFKMLLPAGQLVIGMFRTMAVAAWASIGPWGLVAAAIIFLGVAIWQNWFGIRDKLGGVFAFIQGAVSRLSAWFTGTAVPAIAAFAAAVGGFLNGVILPAISAFVGAVWPLLSQIIGLWIHLHVVVVEFAIGLVTQIAGIVIPALLSFAESVGSVVGSVIGFFVGLWDGISGAFVSFGEALAGGIDVLTSWATSIATAIATVVSSVATGVGQIVSTVTGIYSSITNAFTDIYNFFYNVGWSIIAGMAAGIQSVWSTLMGWMDSIIGQIDRIPGWLRPGSPAKTAIPWGASLVQGIAAGVQNAMPELQSAMGTVQTNMVPTLPASSAGAGVAGTGSAASTAGSSVTIGPGAVQITITGAVDSSTAMELRNGVYQALERLIAGGVAGVPA